MNVRFLGKDAIKLFLPCKRPFRYCSDYPATLPLRLLLQAGWMAVNCPILQRPTEAAQPRHPGRSTSEQLGPATGYPVFMSTSVTERHELNPQLPNTHQHYFHEDPQLGRAGMSTSVGRYSIIVPLNRTRVIRFMRQTSLKASAVLPENQAGVFFFTGVHEPSSEFRRRRCGCRGARGQSHLLLPLQLAGDRFVTDGN